MTGPLGLCGNSVSSTYGRHSSSPAGDKKATLCSGHRTPPQLTLTPSAHLLGTAETRGYAGTNWLEQVGYQAGQRLSEPDLSPLTLAPLTSTDLGTGVPGTLGSHGNDRQLWKGGPHCQGRWGLRSAHRPPPPFCRSSKSPGKGCPFGRPQFRGQPPTPSLCHGEPPWTGWAGMRKAEAPGRGLALRLWSR